MLWYLLGSVVLGVLVFLYAKEENNLDGYEISFVSTLAGLFWPIVLVWVIVEVIGSLLFKVLENKV